MIEIAIAIIDVTVGVSEFLAAVGSINANEAGARGDDDVMVNGLRSETLTATLPPMNDTILDSALPIP